MKSWRAALVLFLALAAAAAGVRAAEPAVKDLTCAFKGKDLLVSFDLADALDAPETKEAINSTKPFSLTFTVNIVRHLAAWPDTIKKQRVVVHTVRFDNLTRQYILETTLDGQKTDKRKVATWDEMAAYMTSIRDLPFMNVAELDLKSGKFALRAKVLVRTDYMVVIFPYDVETPWAVKPLLPP